jgi:hypothetical protein
MNYVKSMLIIDLTATVLSDILILASQPHSMVSIWGFRLKLFRIFRLGYIRDAYKGLISIASSRIPRVGKLIDFILGATLEIIFWIHLMTCIWIKLGSLSCYDNKWREATTLNPPSWMFIEGSDFNGAQD